MAVIRKNLGPASAYAYAVAGGYTGTEQEFAQEIGSASTSAQAAVAAVSHYPKIGTNGNWQVWDATNNTWADTGIAASAHSAIDETVTGTTPSITGVDNHRYKCGEVSSLTIVTPATGIIDVIFESGSTATVLTVTPPTGMTMLWPDWFDPSDLDEDTMYEISIVDGIYGMVMTWQT